MLVIVEKEMKQISLFHLTNKASLILQIIPLAVHQKIQMKRYKSPPQEQRLKILETRSLLPKTSKSPLKLRLSNHLHRRRTKSSGSWSPLNWRRPKIKACKTPGRVLKFWHPKIERRMSDPNRKINLIWIRIRIRRPRPDWKSRLLAATSREAATKEQSHWY